MDKEYLQLSFKDGKFYAYSKTEKEGYEPHTNTKGDVSYRKYYDAVEGTLESVSLHDGKYGDVLSVRLVVEDSVKILQFQVLGQKGWIDTFTESLLTFLPNMKKGEFYKMVSYNFIPEGEKYSKKGVSFRDSKGEKVEKALRNSYYKDGVLNEFDIPAVEYVEFRGKKERSESSLRDIKTYLYTIIDRECERLGYESSSSPEPANHKEVSKERVSPINKVEVPIVDIDDDLPF